MPTLREAGLDFMIYTLDHEPSHVHVWKAGKQLVIILGDEVSAPDIRENYGMSKKNKRKALQIAGEHQDFLISEWRRIHGDS
jgi:hypothetical protein